MRAIDRASDRITPSPAKPLTTANTMRWFGPGFYPRRELGVRSGMGTSPWVVSDELWLTDQ